MKSLTGNTRTAFLIFFASHIPITLLMNGQTVLPAAFFPDFLSLRGILPFYAALFNDTLMTAPFDIWLQSFVVCEVLLQVPFFILAIRSLLSMDDGSGWFRTACLIYGSHAVTTLIPILTETVLNEVNTVTEKVVLVGFYIPYLIFPAWLVYIAATCEDVFVGPLLKAKIA
jgi:hypothetical protein